MFKRKPFYIAIMLVTLSAVLFGCGSSNTDNGASGGSATASSTAAASASAASPSPSAEPSGPRIVTDDIGDQVEVPSNPVRVVAPYLEDALLSLGVKPAAQWSAGELLLNYLQPELQDVPKLDFVAFSPEQVASFEPDLFIVPFAIRVQNGAYDQFSKIAPTYVFEDATKDWRKTLLTLGDLLGRNAEAEQALADYDAKMAGFKQELQAKTTGKKAAIMLISEKSFSLMQDETYSGKVVYGELGLQPTSEGKGSDWKELSLETLPDLDADYIFLMQVDGKDPLANKDLDSIYNTPIWKSMKAVKEGHVYSVDRDYWINTGLKANVKVAEDVQKLLSGS
ncbi:ABC transporter substrate-binding protein [Cohnella sp. GCM10020058]|uniref:ABC transporter substrate-binding protein n=1 Tax=Cohnella sp. GCM10020058 TaxID=3317330 RepID=UPI00363986C6